MRLQVVSDESVAHIEDTAYRLLEEVGIALQHARATEMLVGLGCRTQNGRVHIPREVVSSCLRRLPAHKTFRSADGRREVTLGDGVLRFHNAGGPPFIYDLETGLRRHATLRDLADASRLLDALPHVDVVLPLCSAQDVPAEIMAIASVEAMLRNTRKPVHAAYAEKPEDVHFLVKLAQACCGGEAAYRRHPTTAIMVSPISPLTFSELVTSTIMAVAESGTPFHSLPAPSLGATGPITMAGCVAQQHAEVLASFVIAAATNPDTPVMYCSRINPIDLRSAVSTWGNPEVGLTAACAAQLAHRLGLMCNAYGLCTSAALLDPQFAYERLFNAFVPALAGVDILSGVGVLENNMAVSLIAAVIDDEIISQLKYVVGGVDVSPEALALDVMQQVIPGDGVFLGDMHTVRQMRRGAVWIPTIGERAGSSAEGELAGVLPRARARARAILDTHQVEPLPQEVSRQLDSVMAEAWQTLTEA